MEQEVQLVEDSLQSSNQASNPHTARWRIYTDMGRDLFSQVRIFHVFQYESCYLEYYFVNKKFED